MSYKLTPEEEKEFDEYMRDTYWSRCLECCDYEGMCENLKTKLATIKHNARKTERQFILNVLDGIDIADKQIKNKGGGTKAIRLALHSRSI